MVMDFRALKPYILKIVCGVAAFLAGGCADGIYGKVRPAYDLAAHQDKKILIWVEASRSAVADVDAPDKLAETLGGYLIANAKIKSSNIVLSQGNQHGLSGMSQTLETAVSGTDAGLVLFVQIEEYELLPLNVDNFYSGRMLTRAVLLDAYTQAVIWPASQKGKPHDIVVELGKGGRDAVLSQMTKSTAHCIVRNLYPIMKMHYKNSDERVSLQEAFETETF